MCECCQPFGDASHHSLLLVILCISPASWELHFWRTLSPYFTKIGSPAFRCAVAKMLPTRGMKEMRSLVETLSTKTREIYSNKRAALEKGDHAILHEVGEGKDIMSILCKSQQYTLMTLRRPSGGSRECSSTSKHGSIERGYTVR